jgi:hypothetical protein
METPASLAISFIPAIPYPPFYVYQKAIFSIFSFIAFRLNVDEL